MSRTIAIGDIHGCTGALRSLLDQIQPRPNDLIITLGDYVDKGPDSRGTLDLLADLSRDCRLIPLLGNHDEMMLRARHDVAALQTWLSNGGLATLQSYGPEAQIDAIPQRHFDFIESCADHFETDTHLFLHANYRDDVPAAELDPQISRWLSLREMTPSRPHCSGKIVIVGHTRRPEILDLGYLICLDTACVAGGCLTAMDVHTRQLWTARQPVES
jgi:serine/threonine protein phosphatase 1